MAEDSIKATRAAAVLALMPPKIIKVLAVAAPSKAVDSVRLAETTRVAEAAVVSVAEAVLEETPIDRIEDAAVVVDVVAAAAAVWAADLVLAAAGVSSIASAEAIKLELNQSTNATAMVPITGEVNATKLRATMKPKIRRM